MLFHLRDFVGPGEVCHFARLNLQTSQASPLNLHDHTFPEVFWVEAGQGWHHINGLKRELRPGHLVLVAPTDCHTITSAESKSIRIVNVAFFRRSWRYVHQRYFASIPDPFRLSEQEREFCLSGGSAIRLETLAAHFIPPQRAIAQVEGFLLDLGNTILSGLDFRRDQMPDWLLRACRGVREPDGFARGTHGFASLAGRSPDHVAREAKRWLNKTPTEIVNEARMEYAAAHLISGDETIADIAMQCGLNNLSHFYELFDARFHTTPRRYRLQGRRIVGDLSDRAC